MNNFKFDENYLKYFNNKLKNYKNLGYQKDIVNLRVIIII